MNDRLTSSNIELIKNIKSMEMLKLQLAESLDKQVIDFSNAITIMIMWIQIHGKFTDESFTLDMIIGQMGYTPKTFYAMNRIGFNHYLPQRYEKLSAIVKSVMKRTARNEQNVLEHCEDSEEIRSKRTGELIEPIKVRVKAWLLCGDYTEEQAETLAIKEWVWDNRELPRLKDSLCLGEGKEEGKKVMWKFFPSFAFIQAGATQLDKRISIGVKIVNNSANLNPRNSNTTEIVDFATEKMKQLKVDYGPQ